MPKFQTFIKATLIEILLCIKIWFTYDFFFFFLSDVTVLGICVKTKSYATPLYISVAIVTLYVLMAIVRVGPLVTWYALAEVTCKDMLEFRFHKVNKNII